MQTHRQEHPVSVEGGDQHHAKRSGLSRVKDKVKKFEDTIRKKKHGQGDDEREHHEQDNEVREEEGHEEEEVEREAEPEVHGAPMYESAAAGRNSVGERDENLGPGKASLGDQATGIPVEKDPAVAKKSDRSQLLSDTTAGERDNSVRNRDEILDPDKVSSRAVARSVEEDPPAPKGRTETTPAAATEQDHPSYSPVKGGDEVGGSPLPSSFQAMSLSDKPKGQHDVLETPPTGTHDQFSPEKPQQENPKEEIEEQKSSSYTEKISSTAAVAKDTTVSAAIGSAEYGKKIASTVYDKVSGAGAAIMGKGTPESQQGETKPGKPEKGVSDKGVPGEEDGEVKGSPTEGAGGKGMVDKIKGAGTAGSPRASPTTNLDTEEKEAATGEAENKKREEKMQ